MPTISKRELLAALPAVWPEVLPEVSAHLATRSDKLVVLDDDPTGTQTVRNITVVTRWDVETLQRELCAPGPGFFILTNSRSIDESATLKLHRELGRNLTAAAAAAGVGFTIVSRSDSTLRGHFPLETDALAEVCGPFDATLLVPYFEAGGRMTIGDTHYVAEGDQLVPAAETPFARDQAFGYRHSHLPSWVEEKTRGRVAARDVVTIPLSDLRQGGPLLVMSALLALPEGAVCIANASERRDVEVLAFATLLAEAQGRRFAYRTAASFVAARLGQAPTRGLDCPLAAAANTEGGLVVVGSYVPKTTMQLGRLRAAGWMDEVELPVAAILDASRRAQVVNTAATALRSSLSAGRDALLFTSRELVAGADAVKSLEIGQAVSAALIEIVRKLERPPRYFVAKGGITSSDLATQGLDVVRARVLGQVLPGIPVWELGEGCRFPGLVYVVFPGNVGDEQALHDVVSLLRPQPTGRRSRQ
jgi:uncharacterized protein YgbK (DUF1537 family)